MGQFDSIKGPPIKVVFGDYKGCTGWTNKQKGSSPQMISVILKNNPPAVEAEEVRKRLSKLSVRELTQEEQNGVANIEQATLKQKKDINNLMEKLVMEMTKCGLNPSDNGQEMGRLFRNKWTLANKAWESMDEPPVRLVKYFGNTTK